MVANFFHRLFNPHCAQCREDAHCKNCDTLREILNEERYEKRRLIDKLLPNEPEQMPVATPAPLQLRKQYVPWRVRAAELEQEDKARLSSLEAQKAQILPVKSVEQLEEELGVTNG